MYKVTTYDTHKRHVITFKEVSIIYVEYDDGLKMLFIKLNDITISQFGGMYAEKFFKEMLGVLNGLYS